MGPEVAAAAALVAAGSSIMNGINQGNAMKAQASMMERQASRLDMQSAQVSAARRKELSSALAAISAQRASRNVDPNSPGAQAQDDAVRRESRVNEMAERLGIAIRQGDIRANASMTRRGAAAAYASGLIDAIPSMIDAGGSFASMGAGKGASKGASGAAAKKAAMMG